MLDILSEKKMKTKHYRKKGRSTIAYFFSWKKIDVSAWFQWHVYRFHSLTRSQSLIQSRSRTHSQSRALLVGSAKLFYNYGS